jgi:CRP/FNR family transcriptional regulator
MTSTDGKAVILRIAKPGEVLGLHAVVSGQPYQASAETVEPCQVNFIRREDFLQFLRNNGEASIHAAQQLSANYQSACEQIRSLGLTHSASEKVARFLLDSSANGQETKQGIRIRMTMTHEEIGQIIGTSRETVTRTLGDFKNKRLVAINGSVLLIPNKTALETVVGS